MTEYFPLLSPSPGALPTAPAKSSEPVKPTSAISDEGEASLLSPGESYKIYNARDVLGTIPLEFEVVVQRAARWSGVGEDYISHVVEHFERRLRRWWIRRKKGEKMDEPNDSDDQEDMLQ